MNSFAWPERNKIHRQPGKLKYKVPMEHKVVTENFELYEYSIINKKVHYIFLSFLSHEKEEIPKPSEKHCEKE